MSIQVSPLPKNDQWEKACTTFLSFKDAQQKRRAAFSLLAPLSDQEIHDLYAQKEELNDSLSRDIALNALGECPSQILADMASALMQIKKSLRFPKGLDPHDLIFHDFLNRCIFKLLECLPDSIEHAATRKNLFHRFSIKNYFSFATQDKHSGYNPLVDLLWSRKIQGSMKLAAAERMTDTLRRETGESSKYYPRKNEGKERIKPSENYEHASFWLAKIAVKYSSEESFPYPLEIFLCQIGDAMPLIPQMQFGKRLHAALLACLPGLALREDASRPSICRIIDVLDSSKTLAGTA